MGERVFGLQDGLVGRCAIERELGRSGVAWIVRGIRGSNPRIRNLIEMTA
ncbi:MAG TPA: hypothetical protein VJQ46_11100 [Gemmatimonadales bacterium]|nr:hypothetical protein [Gemmatimonadales bacterium]